MYILIVSSGEDHIRVYEWNRAVVQIVGRYCWKKIDMFRLGWFITAKSEIHQVIVACAHLSNSTSQHGALWCFSQCTGSFWLLMCPFNSTCSVLHVFASANRSVNCHCIGLCCRCPSSAIEKPVLHYLDAQSIQCELQKDLLLLAKILHQLIDSLSHY